jgi:arabinan endo-1,5-alpha-L-arabinosidase
VQVRSSTIRDETWTTLVKEQPVASARTRIFARVGGVALALGLLATAATGTALAAPPGADARSGGGAAAIEPVIDANFPDPDILLVGGVYHAYATNDGGQNVQHQTSTDLVHWTPRPDVLPTLGAWVGDCSFAPGGATDRCIWAPR